MALQGIHRFRDKHGYGELSFKLTAIVNYLSKKKKGCHISDIDFVAWKITYSHILSQKIWNERLLAVHVTLTFCKFSKK